MCVCVFMRVREKVYMLFLCVVVQSLCLELKPFYGEIFAYKMQFSLMSCFLAFVILSTRLNHVLYVQMLYIYIQMCVCASKWAKKALGRGRKIQFRHRAARSFCTSEGKASSVKSGEWKVATFTRPKVEREDDDDDEKTPRRRYSPNKDI